MTTPNEQPVSDTPRSDSKFDVQKFHREAQGLVNKSDHISLMAGTPLISDVAVWMANFSMRNRDFARQLERELNQANEKLDFVLTSLEEGSLPHANNKLVDALAKNVELALQLERANQYRAELEAVARAADNGCLCCGTNAHSNLRESIDVLKSKGWK